MKSVALKDLKENLSYWAELAAQGEVVEVTKYNNAFIRLGPAMEEGLIVGTKVGKVSLVPVGKNLSKGKWLDFLEQDRS